MKMYKSELVLGGVSKNLVCVNLKAEVEKKETTVDKLHHIHVLDRSYSMSRDLNRLVENVKETMNVMADNDLLSVIWFSGENECKTLLKGALKTQEGINELLDTLKTPVGCTCFSEPLKHVNEVINDLGALCGNFSVTFFTDGETVTHHSEAEEERRIFEQIDLMKDKVMALNCIGYGHYYNEKLLLEMAAKTVFGRFVHSSKIDEYNDIWSHTYSELSDMVLEKTVIEVKNDEEILYLTNKSTKLVNGKLELNFMNKIKNQIFMILDKNTTEFKINDETYKVNEITNKIPKPSFMNAVYSLGYEFAYAGRTEDALDVYANLAKDKSFVDGLINAFSVDERENIKKALKKAIFVNKNRLKDGSCPDGYLPKEDAFCVMDLIKLLSKDDRNLMYWVDNYNRIGLKTEEGFVNLFRKTDKETTTSFSNLVFNEKSLNASLRFMINGEVKINPKQAEKLQMSDTLPSRIYRVQTIIKDGYLNIDKIKVRMMMDTYVELMKILKEQEIDGVMTREGLPVEHEGTAEGKTISDCFVDVELTLSDLPIINKMYSKDADDLETIERLVREIEENKAYTKVAKFFLDNIVKSKVLNEGISTSGLTFTPEQVEVLKEHGLNTRLEYVGVDTKLAEKNEDDFYMSRLLEFKLKGFSSLPKVDDVRKKVIEGKKLNAPAQVMAEAIDKYNEMDEEQLKDELSRLSYSTQDNKITLSTMKMAKILTGSWWNDLGEADKKGNYNFNDLIIRTGYEKKYF